MEQGGPAWEEQLGRGPSPAVLRTLMPCACLSPEPVQACVLNGTIIGVSCRLLLQGAWGAGMGCCGKGVILKCK